jgi:hypothetical protein
VQKAEPRQPGEAAGQTEPALAPGLQEEDQPQGVVDQSGEEAQRRPGIRVQRALLGFPRAIPYPLFCHPPRRSDYQGRRFRKIQS